MEVRSLGLRGYSRHFDDYGLGRLLEDIHAQDPIVVHDDQT